MILLQFSSGSFDWNKILFGDQNWEFLLETGLRTFIMFLVVLFGLTILGKRGVKQLSVFELVVIIGLGSAAGDPMFYKDVGVLPAIVVFIIVITLYILVTHLVGKHKSVEQLLEGKPVCLIRDGRFCINEFKKETLGQDEFFAELRMQSVSQLGQIEQAIIETSGDISLFFYPDEQVKDGLTIMPDAFEQSIEEIKETGFYACTFCGNTVKLQPISEHLCDICKGKTWVKASNRKRIN